MEVGEMRDPQAVELGRDAVELDLEDAAAQPARLEPAPRKREEGKGRQHEERPAHFVLTPPPK
jgi:hypothetical protein